MTTQRETLKKNTSRYKKIFHEDFRHKIKSTSQVKKIIGNFPRKNKVVMCHGTFDGAHVGHLRQLSFARKMAPVLIVSLTKDKYVTKGELRPWYPEDLRAYQLSSIEYVDYVILDNNPTPTKNILRLKPDIFVKGFEYKKDGIHPLTQEEIETLKTYGGKMIFSPGDFVDSSSKIISERRPSIAYERLLTLMREEEITFKDLVKTVQKFKKVNIHVLGDLILDKYTYCLQQLGQSSDEDVPSVLYDRSEMYVGGVGVIAQHVKSLGGDVSLSTIIGDDDNGKFALKNLRKNGINTKAILDDTRPTTLKERFIGKHGKPIFKFNTQETRPISDDALISISRRLKRSKANAVIFGDFRHGIFNKRTIPDLVKAIPEAALKVADSQVRTRWGNILQFQDFDLITPSEKEARWALADEDTPLRPMAQELYNATGCKYLIMTLGENGALTYRSPGIEHRELFYLESFAKEVNNDIGAGDALLAAATLSLAATGNIVQSVIIGNICAGIECSKSGNEPVSKKELLDQISAIESESSYGKKS